MITEFGNYQIFNGETIADVEVIPVEPHISQLVASLLAHFNFSNHILFAKRETTMDFKVILPRFYVIIY